MQKEIILNGKNTIRRILLIIAVLMLLICVITIIRGSNILAVPLIMFSLIILFFIQFPRIIVDQYRITVEKTGLIKNLNIKETYNLKDVKEAKFNKGDDIPSSLFILSFYRFGGFGPRTKSDQMILEFNNGQNKIINRINSRDKFIGITETINNLIKKQST